MQKIYAEKPVFDELTEYLVEKEPVEKDGVLFVGFEVKTVISDTPIEIKQSDGEFVEFVKPLTIEERVETLEVDQAISNYALMMGGLI